MFPPYQTAPVPRQGLLDHPILGLCEYRLSHVSAVPERQVEEVIGLMRDYALADSESPAIKQDVARSTVSGDPIADTWNWIARHGGSRGMTFQRDEITAGPIDLDVWNPVVETLIRPADQCQLREPIGDCDDFAMWGAAQLKARKVDCSFVTIAADANAPQIFSHVYLAAYPRYGQYAGMRVPLDLSHGMFPGWEHGQAFRLQEWPVVKTWASSLLWGVAAGAGAYLLYRAFQEAN
jgi:hypothetical protein